MFDINQQLAHIYRVYAARVKGVIERAISSKGNVLQSTTGSTDSAPH